MTDKQWRQLVLDLWKFFAEDENGDLDELLKLKARVERAVAIPSTPREAPHE